MLKKTLRATLILMIFTMAINIESSKPKAASIFPDASGHWAEGAINYLYNTLVVNGLPNGTFGVNNNISRKDAALMIARAKNLDLDNISGEASFTDVEVGSYYYEAVVAASDAGFLSGYPDRTFRPDGNLTRAEMASILVKAFGLENRGGDVFYDVTPGSWQFQPIQTLVTYNITSGYPDGSFRPDNSISRAEFSMLLARAMDERFRNHIIRNGDIFIEEKDGKFVVNGISIGMHRDEVLSILGNAVEEKLPDADDAFRGDGQDPNYLLADYGEISLEYYANILTHIYINMNEATYEQGWYKALGEPYHFHAGGPYMFYLEGDGHLLAHREGETRAWLTWADGNFYDGLDWYYRNQADRGDHGDREGDGEQGQEQDQDQEQVKEEEQGEEPISEGNNQYGNWHGNINHAGVFTEDDEAFYFADNDGIYKFTDSGSYLLSNDQVATFLNVQNGWLYYSLGGFNNQGVGIYKMRTDGTERTLLSNEYGMFTNVVGDWMYYMSVNSLYKMRVDGSERTYITNVLGTGQIIVHNDWIYYNQPEGLFKMRTDGSQQTKLINDNAFDMQIVDDWLYYIGSNNTVARISLDGNIGESIFHNASVARMNMDDDYIYFTLNYSDGLYRINHDGSNFVALTAGSIDKISIVNDTVYALIMFPGTSGFEWYRVS